jgi:hypothetical protein
MVAINKLYNIKFENKKKYRKKYGEEKEMDPSHK